MRIKTRGATLKGMSILAKAKPEGQSIEEIHVDVAAFSKSGSILQLHFVPNRRRDPNINRRVAVVVLNVVPVGDWGGQ